MPAHATRLRELTADNAAQQGQLVRLDGLIGAKLSELATTIQIRREAGLDAASRIVRSDVGIRVMGDIRTLLAAMREEESRLYAAREIRLDEAAHTATAVNIAGLVVAFALVIGATVLTMRALRHRAREQALRQTSEAVAVASQESEARLRTTLESIGDAVIATDDEGRVTLMNPVAQALTGWTDAGARGRPIEEVLTLVNEATRLPVENPVTKVRREGTIVGLANHTILISRDGREIPIADSAAPIRVAGGRVQGVVVVFRDVTDQYELERQRASVLQVEQAARQEAEAANRAKDEFLATLSHELRTPLNAILGWAQHAARTGALDAGRRRATGCEIIERNARAQAQLIDDLLDISRIISGKLRLELRPVDLRRASCEAALDAVRPGAPRPRASASDAAGRATRRPVAGDPDRLQQVVWNLLTNAIKFTPGAAGASTSGSSAYGRPGADRRGATPAPASRRSSCRTSSSASARPTLVHAHARRASASAWRSSATWSSCTAARSWRRARARGAAPPSPCACRAAHQTRTWVRSPSRPCPTSRIPHGTWRGCTCWSSTTRPTPASSRGWPSSRPARASRWRPRRARRWPPSTPGGSTCS